MKRNILIVLGIVLTLSITGCTNDDSALEDENPPLVEDEDIDQPETEEEEIEEEDVQEEEEIVEDTDEVEDQEQDETTSDKWPAEFMPEAPELKGDITVAKEEGPNKYFLKYSNLGHDKAEEYVESLRDAGFTENLEEESRDDFIKYKAMDSNNNLIVFIWKKGTITKLELIKKDN